MLGGFSLQWVTEEGKRFTVARESETTFSAAATDHLYLVALAARAN